jgi:hypothetical protein
VRRRPFSLTWWRERVAGWRDSTCCEGRGRAWVEGSPTHINASMDARSAQFVVVPMRNGLGAVNGRNADGLGVLEGLLYDVRASVRDQSPGRTLTQRGRGEHLFWIHTESPPPDLLTQWETEALSPVVTETMPRPAPFPAARCSLQPCTANSNLNNFKYQFFIDQIPNFYC